MLLISQLINETKDSGIVRDMGDAFKASVLAVLVAQLLLIIVIFVVQAWGMVSSQYYLER